MLAVTAQESVANRCIVIGEDLGTVPDNFRETLADWGLWSYQVMLFERGWDGAFRHAGGLSRECARDLRDPRPADLSRAGSKAATSRSSADLGIDPGETDEQRQAALAALRHALVGARRSHARPCLGLGVSSPPRRRGCWS